MSQPQAFLLLLTGAVLFLGIFIRLPAFMDRILAAAVVIAGAVLFGAVLWAAAGVIAS